MESMGKRCRRRRSFTPEFKAEIVEPCQRGDRSAGQVAKDFDLTETAVREWVKQAERDAGTRQDGLSTPGRGRPGQRPAGQSWSTSPGTTAPGCIAPWATAARPTSKTTTTKRSAMVA
jgi:transposase